MICIANDQLGAGFSDGRGRHRFNAGGGRRRHKAGRLKGPVGRGYGAAPCLLVGCFQLK